MSNILFLYENNSPSAELTKRHYEMWKELCSPDSNIVYRSDASLTSFDLNWADVLIVIRGLSPYEKSICELAKRRNIFVVLHIDDDMLNPPEGYIQLKQRTKSLKRIIEISDAVVTNPYLKQKYENINNSKRVILTDTPVKEENIVYKTGSNKIKMVYPAGKDHAILFERILVPAFEKLPEECAKKISIDFIGNKPKVDTLKNIETNFIEHMSMENYEKHMAKSDYDIGLAPLEISEFNKGKYYNKYISFAKYGIVGIYTNMEPYNYIIKDKENGVLCNNTPESWIATISDLIFDKSIIEEMRAHSYNDLKERFSPKTIITKYDSDLPELNSHKSNDIKVNIVVKKLIRICFSIREKLYFLFKHLKKDGIKSTINRIFKHVKLKRDYGEL